MTSTMSIAPPQHLHMPGLMPIRSKAVCCHGFGGVLAPMDFVPNDFLIMDKDFPLEALDRNP